MNAESSRKRILDRLRQGLASGSRQGRDPAAVPQHGAGPLAEGIFAPIEDPLARFRAECEANRTELHLVTAENETDCLRGLLEDAQRKTGSGAGPGVSRVFVQDEPELRRLMETVPAPVRWSSEGPTEGTDFSGVTLAEALVARTGSVLISSRLGGRAASVLPPLHIVYAQISQLTAELGEALERVPAGGGAGEVSMAGLITGPSRTSDIEKMLVLGAHGPRRLVILLRL